MCDGSVQRLLHMPQDTVHPWFDHTMNDLYSHVTCHCFERRSGVLRGLLICQQGRSEVYIWSEVYTWYEVYIVLVGQCTQLLLSTRFSSPGHEQQSARSSVLKLLCYIHFITHYLTGRRMKRGGAHCTHLYAAITGGSCSHHIQACCQLPARDASACRAAGVRATSSSFLQAWRVVCCHHSHCCSIMHMHH